MTAEKKEDLILKYIQNNLTVEEKMELFQLTLADEEFRERLKEELKLVKKLRDNSIELDRKVKDRIYQEIRFKAVKENLSRESINDLIIRNIFKLTLPGIARPIFNLFKKY